MILYFISFRIFVNPLYHFEYHPVKTEINGIFPKYRLGSGNFPKNNPNIYCFIK